MQGVEVSKGLGHPEDEAGGRTLQNCCGGGVPGVGLGEGPWGGVVLRPQINQDNPTFSSQRRLHSQSSLPDGLIQVLPPDVLTLVCRRLGGRLPAPSPQTGAHPVGASETLAITQAWAPFTHL